MNDDFKPSGPGLWMFPPNDPANMVDRAKANLLSLLKDPYYYEALQRLLREKHSLVSPIKKGGPYPRKGELAKSILDRYRNINKKPRGAPRINRPGLTTWLTIIDRRYGKTATKKQIESVVNSVFKKVSNITNVYKRNKAAKEFAKELRKERDRQRHRVRRISN